MHNNYEFTFFVLEVLVPMYKYHIDNFLYFTEAAVSTSGDSKKKFFSFLFYVLPTFRRKVGIGFARGSTVGSKFSGRFEMKELRKNYFYGLIYIHTFFCVSRPGGSNQSIELKLQHIVVIYLNLCT